MGLEIDFDVLVSATFRRELVDMQSHIAAVDEESGKKVLDLNQIIPEPKDEESNEFGDLTTWREHKWETGARLLPCEGLEEKDIFYNKEKDLWQVKLSLHTALLSVMERLANMYLSLDFVVTIYTRDGCRNEHFEYCLTRTFYNSLYESATVGGGVYAVKSTPDGEKTIIKDEPDNFDDDFLFSEKGKEEESSSDKDGTDIEF